MKKIIILGLVTVFCLIFSAGVCAASSDDAFLSDYDDEYVSLFAEGNFSDVPGKHWAYQYVMTLKRYNVINGYTGNVFKPDNKITRAEVVTMCAQMWGASIPPAYGTLPFNDISGHWAKNTIVWAYNNGIISGVGNGKFAPDDYVTRQDLACIAVRYAQDAEKATIPEFIAKSTFKDDNQIASYASASVYKLQKAEIVSGSGNKYFYPKNNITRAEISRVFYGIFLNSLMVRETSNYGTTTLLRGGIWPTVYQLDSQLGQYYRVTTSYVTLYKVFAIATIDQRGSGMIAKPGFYSNVDLKRDGNVIKSRTLEYPDSIFKNSSDIKSKEMQHCSIYKSSTRAIYSTQATFVGVIDVSATEGQFASCGEVKRTVSVNFQ